MASSSRDILSNDRASTSFFVAYSEADPPQFITNFVLLLLPRVCISYFVFTYFLTDFASLFEVMKSRNVKFLFSFSRSQVLSFSSRNFLIEVTFRVRLRRCRMRRDQDWFLEHKIFTKDIHTKNVKKTQRNSKKFNGRWTLHSPTKVRARGMRWG